MDALASAVAEGAVARAQSRAGELLEVARALLRVYTGEGLQQEPSRQNSCCEMQGMRIGRRNAIQLEVSFKWNQTLAVPPGWTSRAAL